MVRLLSKEGIARLVDNAVQGEAQKFDEILQGRYLGGLGLNKLSGDQERRDEICHASSIITPRNIIL